jgi:transposase InsO family protein
VIEKQKPSELSLLEGLADHVPEPSVASALDVCSGATPADVRQSNTIIRRGRSKPDVSTSLRIGHFYLAPTIRQGVKEYFGGFSGGSAAGLRLRHDHGSVYMSDDFQAEIQFLGIEASPAFVRQPEGNGCIERFFRTLKEQLLWLHRFADLEELRAALIEFRHRYNRHWIVERLGYRTPVQARRDFNLELQAAA